MITVRTVSELRSATAGAVPTHPANQRLGLVPTMGAFHDGHLSLMRQARRDCDVVVVSLFVNPTQFNEGADLAAYPRDEQRDATLAAQAGVDVLFAPGAEEVYPDGFTTTIHVSGLSASLEGAHRGASHFDGVATVVTKLLNMVGPQVAYFGQKDAQQALVIRRLVRDLNMPVEIAVCPTVREDDGLAMSSRNVRLSADDRVRALSLSRALASARRATETGERDATAIAAAARAELDAAGVETEYFELVDADTLAPAQAVNGRPLLAVVAARVGDVRLIDNQILNPHPTRMNPHPTHTDPGAQ
jgi:pantoate--beta-alanine ligase